MAITSRCAILILTALTFRLHSIAAAPPRAAARRLVAPQDGDLKLHEATFIASHNAHAALAVAEGFLEPLGANQDDDIIDQLANDGVRALMLDLMLNMEEDEPLRLVHGSSFLTLDYGGFRTRMGSNLVPFLEENQDAIISLFFETKGDVGEGSVTVRATILNQLQNIFSSMTVGGMPLKDMTFKYDHELWKNHEDWPKLDEIRQSGQRIFVITDRSEFVNTEYGFMHNRQVLQENNWEGIDACEARYMWRSETVSFPTNDYWTRLFFMNHFCCGSGPEAKGNTVGQNLIGGGNNGWGSLYPRIQQCMLNNGGFKPNFIALDWVAQSKEAQEIRDYLNFGGRLGSGQACTEDSHCATSSCNVALGVCQCQQCPSDRVNICLGCSSGQYCASPDGEEMNTCIYKEGGLQSNLPNDIQGTSDISSSTQSPTQSPTDTILSNQYCGVDWNTAVATCNVAVKCPRGNDDCPEGQTCFANLNVCPSAPTQSPSHKPSDFPSPSPSTSLSPIEGGADLSSILVGAGTATATGSKFCGTDFYYTRDNCQSAVPCPEGNYQCGHLGPGYTCFNIICGGPTDGSLIASLGFTKAPAGAETGPPTASSTSAAPTTSPSLRPTKAPFDSLNKNYCGGNYTDAQENCFDRKPCPTGSPTICGSGTCYSGITCNAPPSASPTSSPAARPVQSLVYDEPGSPSPGNGAQGSRPQGDQSPGNQPQNEATQWGQWGESQTEEPFDIEAYENHSSGVAKSANELMACKVAQVIVASIGFVGLLV